jgi:hypothetical protein
MEKVNSRTLDDGTPAHSFQTLLREMETVVRNTCRTPKSASDAPTFQITTTQNEKQKRALELIAQNQNVDRTRNREIRAASKGELAFLREDFQSRETAHGVFIRAPEQMDVMKNLCTAFSDVNVLRMAWPVAKLDKALAFGEIVSHLPRLSA